MAFKASRPMSDIEGHIPWEKVENMLDFVGLNGSFRDSLLLNCLAYSGRRVGEWIGTEMRRCDECDELYHAEQYNKEAKTVNYIQKCPKCSNSQYSREIVGGVRVMDIKFSEGRIIFHVLKKKRDNLRYKRVPKKLLGMIQRFIVKNNLNEEDYLFQSRVKLEKKKEILGFKRKVKVNKPISRQYVFKIVRKWGKRFGMPMVGKKKIHPHHFRHSWSVHVAKKIKNPNDLRKLQNYLEHSDISITQQYLLISGSESDSLIGEVFEDEEDEQG